MPTATPTAPLSTAPAVGVFGAAPPSTLAPVGEPVRPRAAPRAALLSDNPWRLLVRLALPAVAGMMLIGLNTFIDAVFVGRLVGETGLAGVSLAVPLTLIVSAVTMLIGTGAASVLSRAIGAGDLETQRGLFGHLVALSLVASAVVGPLGVLFAGPLVAFMGGTGEVAAEGRAFFEVYMAGSVFSVYGIAANMLIRAEGRIKEAMLYAGAAMLANMAFCAILMGGFGLGVRGAALANVLSMAFYAVLNTRYLAGGKSSFPIGSLRPRLSRAVVGPILTVGVSGMLAQVMQLVQQGATFKSIAHYGGPADVAFMGAAFRIVLLCVIPVFGIMQAMQPVLGVNYGAGEIGRVRRSYRVFLIGAAAFMTTLWLPLVLFPRAGLSLVLPEHPFSDDDVLNFRLLLGALPLAPIYFTAVSLFQSVGAGRKAGFLIAARQLLFFVPLVLILPATFGVRGIYLAAIGTDALSAAVAAAMAWWALRTLRVRPSEAAVAIA